MERPRIYLSVPHLTGHEEERLRETLRSNWVSTVGPNLDLFERAVAHALGGGVETLAVSSGTAALHLILRYLGVGVGDRIAVSTLTFAGSVFPILYQNAAPVFIDSERASGNMDPELVATYLEDAGRQGTLPRALIVVHLYGQHADLDTIDLICKRYGVVLIEDSAESLGATYKGRQTATTADFSILSFNGNKIITTSGGGMVVARDPNAIKRMRKWANQSREPAVEYVHEELGYNYRMSNLLAGVGLAQLAVLADRVAARRRVADRYARAFRGLRGVSMQPEVQWGIHTRWLSVFFLDQTLVEVTPREVIEALAEENIEARPVWRPMHTQPLFEGALAIGGSVSERFFAEGICLPSSSSLSEGDQDRVVAAFKSCVTRAKPYR